MNTGIQPIPTIYKGYAMRSRLEARWARFFDILGVSWEYEVEGFDLDKDGLYLPDFYFPQWKCWVEIKPATNSQDDLKLWWRKCDAVARGTKQNALLISGTPWPDEYRIFYDENFDDNDWRDIDDFACWNSPAKFAIGRRCDHVYFFVDDLDYFSGRSLACNCKYEKYPLLNDDRLISAYRQARMIRPDQRLTH